VKPQSSQRPAPRRAWSLRVIECARPDLGSYHRCWRVADSAFVFRSESSVRGLDPLAALPMLDRKVWGPLV
jgi:hypothetical protein